MIRLWFCAWLSGKSSDTVFQSSGRMVLPTEPFGGKRRIDFAGAKIRRAERAGASESTPGGGCCCLRLNFRVWTSSVMA